MRYTIPQDRKNFLIASAGSCIRLTHKCYALKDWMTSALFLSLEIRQTR